MSDGGKRRVAVADIGGTNARFAIAVRTGLSVTIEEPAIFSTRDCPTFAHAWSEFGSRADWPV
jgi:glucokinase